MFQAFKDKVQQAQHAVEERIQQAQTNNGEGTANASRDRRQPEEGLLSLDEQERLKVKVSKYESSLIDLVKAHKKLKTDYATLVAEKEAAERDAKASNQQGDLLSDAKHDAPVLAAPLLPMADVAPTVDAAQASEAATAMTVDAVNDPVPKETVDASTSPVEPSAASLITAETQTEPLENEVTLSKLDTLQPTVVNSEREACKDEYLRGMQQIQSYLPNDMVAFIDAFIEFHEDTSSSRAPPPPLSTEGYTLVQSSQLEETRATHAKASEEAKAAHEKSLMTVKDVHQKALAALETRLAEAVQASKNAEAENLEIKGELHRLQRQVDQSSERTSESASDVVKAQADMAALVSQFKKYKAQYNADSVKETKDRMAELERYLQRDRGQLKQLLEQEVKWQSERSRLIAESNILETKWMEEQAQAASLTTQLQSAQSALEEATASLKAIQEKTSSEQTLSLDETQRLRAQNQEMTEKVQVAIKERAALEDQVASLSHMLSQSQHHASEHDAAAQYHQLEKELAALRDTCADLQEETEELRAKLGMTTQRLESATSEAKTWQEKCAALDATLGTLNDALAQEKAERADQEAQVKTLQEALTQQEKRPTKVVTRTASDMSSLQDEALPSRGMSTLPSTDLAAQRRILELERAVRDLREALLAKTAAESSSLSTAGSSPSARAVLKVDTSHASPSPTSGLHSAVLDSASTALSASDRSRDPLITALKAQVTSLHTQLMAAQNDVSRRESRESHLLEKIAQQDQLLNPTKGSLIGLSPRLPTKGVAPPPTDLAPLSEAASPTASQNGHEGASAVSMQYLKNILIKYMKLADEEAKQQNAGGFFGSALSGNTLKVKEHEKRMTAEVLATMMAFTNHERDQCGIAKVSKG